MRITKYLFLFLLLLTGYWVQAQSDSTEMIISPNPFICDATIEFELTANDTVTLVVYNLVGAVIANFFEDSPLPSGSYSINLFGESIQPGIYIVRFVTTGGSDNKKIAREGICETTSVEEPSGSNEEITLYPNPTRDLLNIPIGGEKIIRVTDLQGRVIRTITTDLNTVSLSGLASGHYTVSIFSTNRRLISSSRIVFIE